MQVCGGPGEDLISTQAGSQRIEGADGDDWIIGGRDYDNIRGGWGEDRMDHTDPGGEGKIRADANSDCIYMQYAFHPDSSCGSGSDEVYNGTLLTPPSQCEEWTTSCAGVAEFAGQ
jgi:hypothetical protein